MQSIGNLKPDFVRESFCVAIHFRNFDTSLAGGYPGNRATVFLVKVKSGITNAATNIQYCRVFGELADMIKKDLGRRGPGIFTVPGLMKIKVVRKPATKARRGINPFTGEEMMFKAKPARNVVKVLALKGLKDMV